MYFFDENVSARVETQQETIERQPDIEGVADRHLGTLIGSPNRMVQSGTLPLPTVIL